MSAGSWQAFADVLSEENRCLGELGASALAMTSVLVLGTASEIEAKRVLHAQARVRRTTMMKSGFGELTLGQVCSYAPRALRRSVYLSLRDLRVRGIGLRITVGNNRALITAGLKRISSTIAVMQKNSGESNGTYRRRGVLTPANGSLIVSRKA
jgi:hypothetical protein